MRFSYTLKQEGGGFLAECIESDAAGTGRTPQEAAESLRKALEERMFRPDAVAPPATEERPPIELERVSDRNARASLDPSGPGDAAR
jgi:hypothetical protein